MIAHQVAGKAVRDALFLTTFPAILLPRMMAGAAVLSLLAVVWISRLMTKYSPARVMPVLFGVSACGFVVEWLIGFQSSPAMAIGFYIHMALLGPVLISAFWSLINEHFDPYNAKAAVARIAAGGTIGGVLGGLLAWRAATLVPLHTLVLLLASLHAACLVGTILIRAQRPTVAKPSIEKDSALTLLRREPFLRNLALLVALGSAMSSLLDYVFSSQAAARFDKGAALLSFFSMFWLAVAVVSLVIQLTLGRRVLEKLGLAANIAFLPGVIITGGAIGLVVPGLLTTAVLRGAEAVQRNTLYRSAYELLYTPVAEHRKRSMKALIDIGFDRLGTVFGAGLVMAWLAEFPHHASSYLLWPVVGLAGVTMPIARRLHAGYIKALEHGLRDGATKLDAAAPPETPDSDEAVERDKLIQRVEVLRSVRGISAATEIAAIEAPQPAEGSGRLSDPIRDRKSLPDGRAFLDAPVEETRAALNALTTETTPPIAGFLIPLLAHKELHAEALAVLSRAAPAITGQLIDALIDPKMDFAVRRRIPLALAACTTQRAADGLLLGISDDRFEVRYSCGRALMKMLDGSAGITIERAKILQAILIEVDNRDRGFAPTTFEMDPLELEEAARIDDMLARDRVDRRLEHVFTILGLHLDREPLRMAYRALHNTDVRHRGTALEYLQTILPHDIREAVWPIVGELAALPPARSARDILADLLRTTVVQTRQRRA